MSGLDKLLNEALDLVEAKRELEWPGVSPAIVHFRYDTGIGDMQGHPRYVKVDHLRKQISKSGGNFYWIAGMGEGKGHGREHKANPYWRQYHSTDFYKSRWMEASYWHLNAEPDGILYDEAGRPSGRAGPGGFSAHKDFFITSRFKKVVTFNPNNVVKIDWL